MRWAAFSEDMPCECRQEARPYVLEPDQADAGHARAVDQHWPERLGEHARKRRRVDTIVDQDSAVDEAADNGYAHGMPFCMMHLAVSIF